MIDSVFQQGISFAIVFGKNSCTKENIDINSPETVYNKWACLLISVHILYLGIKKSIYFIKCFGDVLYFV